MDRKSDFWIGNLTRNMILVNLYIFLQNDSIPYNRRVSASKTCVFADSIDFPCFYHHFWIGKLRDNLQSQIFIIIAISDPKITCIGQHKYSGSTICDENTKKKITGRNQHHYHPYSTISNYFL